MLRKGRGLARGPELADRRKRRGPGRGLAGSPAPTDPGSLFLPPHPPAPPAAGGALRREPFPRRGGGARAAAAVRALPPGPRARARGPRAALGSLRGNPAAPGTAAAPGGPPAAAPAGTRQADFLLPPAVSVPERRQVRIPARPGAPLPNDRSPSGLFGPPAASRTGPEPVGAPRSPEPCPCP